MDEWTNGEWTKGECTTYKEWRESDARCAKMQHVPNTLQTSKIGKGLCTKITAYASIDYYFCTKSCTFQKFVVPLQAE